MTKAEIVAGISEETGLERSEALRAVEAFMLSIKKSLLEEHSKNFINLDTRSNSEYGLFEIFYGNAENVISQEEYESIEPEKYNAFSDAEYEDYYFDLVMQPGKTHLDVNVVIEVEDNA